MQTPSTLSSGRHGELETLIIDNAFATAEIALFGAHVLSFKPKKDNRERLWLSPHAVLTGEKPIRGGIPICWPWFGDDNGLSENSLPAHGFLRSQTWSVVSTNDSAESTTIELSPRYTTYRQFDTLMDVKLIITISDTLTITLDTQNLSPNPVKFNAALHSYFYVSNISQCQIMGIEGKYKDKLDNWAIKDTPCPYLVLGQTDRIHLTKTSETTVLDGDNHTLIGHEGHDSVVVWNPWSSAASMSDMDAFGYKHMVCVETAMTQWLALAPNESHALTQRIG